MSWNLVGHEWAEKLLKEHILHDEVRHAYLFTSAPGTGRRSLALEFACAINCLQPPAPGDFCGLCRACTQILKGTQADLSIIQAEGDGGMIKVDQIRALEHSLALSPYESRYRIALLLDFQQANANAQNALLKTLEEAPRQAILILTADSADSLLPTISSRCEILRLRPAAIDELAKLLENRWKIAPELAKLYAHLANGRVGTALQYATTPELMEKRTAMLDDLQRLLTASRRDRFAYAESFSRDRETARETLRIWLSWGRDLLMLVNGAGGEITNLDRQAELAGAAQKIDGGQALQIMNALDEALAALEANGHLRLLFDTVLLDLPRIV